MYKVELVYFKETGKFYSEGTYESNCTDLHDIWDEVVDLYQAGRVPGLMIGSRPDYVLIDVPDHPHRHYRLMTGDMAAFRQCKRLQGYKRI